MSDSSSSRGRSILAGGDQDPPINAATVNATADADGETFFLRVEDTHVNAGTATARPASFPLPTSPPQNPDTGKKRKRTEAIISHGEDGENSAIEDEQDPEAPDGVHKLSDISNDIEGLTAAARGSKRRTIRTAATADSTLTLATKRANEGHASDPDENKTWHKIRERVGADKFRPASQSNPVGSIRLRTHLAILDRLDELEHLRVRAEATQVQLDTMISLTTRQATLDKFDELEQFKVRNKTMQVQLDTMDADKFASEVELFIVEAELETARQDIVALKAQLVLRGAE